MYATTTTGHREHVNGNGQTRVVAQLLVWQTVIGVIIQNEDVVTEEWNGLSYTEAMSLYENKEQSVLNGTTRQYLGSARLEQTGGTGSAFVRAPSCWGTKVATSYNRVNDTNLYHVTRTTTTYTVSGTGSNTQLVLE